MVYGLNNWLRNLNNNFALKHCLFDTVKLIRNVTKESLFIMVIE